MREQLILEKVTNLYQKWLDRVAGNDSFDIDEFLNWIDERIQHE